MLAQESELLHFRRGIEGLCVIYEEALLSVNRKGVLTV